MLANLQLGKKFTLFMSVVFIGGLAVSGTALWKILEREAERHVAANGMIFIDAIRSVRWYTVGHIMPLVRERSAAEDGFAPETVPSYAARIVFERFREYRGYAGYAYKEASVDPTNPQNLADDFEAGLLDQFGRLSEDAELSGFRSLEGQPFFYVARPLFISSEGCLTCHSEPARAPSGLIEQYGADGGFGQRLDQLVAAQIVYVPAQEVYSVASRSFLLAMGVSGGVFVVAILLINLLLRRYVVRPVRVVGGLAQRIKDDQMAEQDLDAQDLAAMARHHDELGVLAQVFRDMAREVHARTQTLKQEVEVLRIGIDVRKRERDMAQIVESDFFKDLKAKARRIRQRHHEDPLYTLQLPSVGPPAGVGPGRGAAPARPTMQLAPSEGEDDPRRTIQIPIPRDKGQR